MTDTPIRLVNFLSARKRSRRYLSSFFPHDELERWGIVEGPRAEGRFREKQKKEKINGVVRESFFGMVAPAWHVARSFVCAPLKELPFYLRPHSPYGLLTPLCLERRPPLLFPASNVFLHGCVSAEILTIPPLRRCLSLGPPSSKRPISDVTDHRRSLICFESTDKQSFVSRNLARLLVASFTLCQLRCTSPASMLCL